MTYDTYDFKTPFTKYIEISSIDLTSKDTSSLSERLISVFNLM